MKKLLVVTMMLGLVGCEPPSMNLQRSAARDTGDTGITIFLDECSEDVVESKKAAILIIIDEIETFIDTGLTGDLTVGVIKSQVAKVVPKEYGDLSSTILDYLAEFKVPTDKVPVKIVKNIKAALLGVRRGVKEYRIEDRKEEPKEEESERPNG